MQKPLIIMYMHKIPYPLENGTARRIIEMVKYLKQYYTIALIIPYYDPNIPYLKEYFQYIWYQIKITGVTGKIKKTLGRHLYSFYFIYKYKRHLRAYAANPFGRYNVFSAYMLEQACLKYKPALIISQKVINTVLCTAIAKKYNIPVIIDTHDIYKLSISQDESRNIVNLHPDVNKIATAKDELLLLQEYDAVIAIQHNEAKVLKYYLPDKPVVTALHPATIVQHTHKKDFYKHSAILLFIGSSSKHNADGLNYFLNTQWPKVLSRFPNTILQICGSVAESVSVNYPSVHLIGRVDDLFLYYDKATIVINPVRYGSGLKIKTVEALANGRCVVTTPNGIEGLEDIEGALVFADADKIHQAIITLLEHPEEIILYENRALSYAEKYLTPQACYSSLLKIMNKITQ